MQTKNLISIALCAAISLSCMAFSKMKSHTVSHTIVLKHGLTSQTLSITGAYTAQKDANGNVTVTFPDGVKLFDRGEPIPIIVVGANSKKVDGPNISLVENPNHVSMTTSGSGTTDAKVSSADWSVEATGVATTLSGF